MYTTRVVYILGIIAESKAIFLGGTYVIWDRIGNRRKDSVCTLHSIEKEEQKVTSPKNPTSRMMGVHMEVEVAIEPSSSVPEVVCV